IKNRIKRIREVGSGETLSYKIYNKLAWNETPGIVYIDLPERLLDENITVLAVDLEGALDVYQGAGHVVTAN
ncbi:MAG: alpha-L-fucosidase, partial [Bacteroidales bacterium]|nr:alpha-L-fucosidase [Bacteroidales bacterium]